LISDREEGPSMVLAGEYRAAMAQLGAAVSVVTTDGASEPLVL
jgi:hypothetical protein